MICTTGICFDCTPDRRIDIRQPSSWRMLFYGKPFTGPKRYVLIKYEINVTAEAITMTIVQPMAKYFWNLLFAK